MKGGLECFGLRNRVGTDVVLQVPRFGNRAIIHRALEILKYFLFEF